MRRDDDTGRRRQGWKLGGERSSPGQRTERHMQDEKERAVVYAMKAVTSAKADQRRRRTMDVWMATITCRLWLSLLIGRICSSQLCYRSERRAGMLSENDSVGIQC